MTSPARVDTVESQRERQPAIACQRNSSSAADRGSGGSAPFHLPAQRLACRGRQLYAIGRGSGFLRFRGIIGACCGGACAQSVHGRIHRWNIPERQSALECGRVFGRRGWKRVSRPVHAAGRRRLRLFGGTSPRIIPEKLHRKIPRPGQWPARPHSRGPSKPLALHLGRHRRALFFQRHHGVLVNRLARRSCNPIQHRETAPIEDQPSARDHRRQNQSVITANR